MYVLGNDPPETVVAVIHRAEQKKDIERLPPWVGQTGNNRGMGDLLRSTVVHNEEMDDQPPEENDAGEPMDQPEQGLSQWTPPMIGTDPKMKTATPIIQTV